MTLVASFVVLCQPLAAVWTAPSFASWLTLITGWLFASQHTVTAMLKAAGALKHKHFSSYHRLLSMARWSRDALGLGLVGMLLPLCSEVGLLSVDDTLCRKFGRKWVSSQLRLITWLHAEPTGWDALPEELRGVRRLVQC